MKGARMNNQTPHAGRVAGKVAIVTGATSGIGRATAVLLAREGASVVAAGRREELGAELVEQLTTEGLSVHFIRTDVSKREDVERLVSGAVERFGRLDIVVNDAALLIIRGVEDCTEDEWDEVIDTNLKSVYLVCHNAIPHLRAAGGGAIVNVSSVHAYATMEGIAPYAASKGAIVSLSRQMALDYTRDRIRVNSLVVGAVDTAMSRKHAAAMGTDLSGGGWVDDDRELGRAGKPEEIAAGILFLVTPESSFVTGSPFFIDGGLLARL
jgi:NAD(P)-dependent dehydrogenase (short-subunit alcohol dehydrogenase family)